MSTQGEIRQALAAAAESFGAQGATWRQLAAASMVGYDLARMTVENMVRAGHLVVVGRAAVPGSCRPMNLCALPSALAAAALAEPMAVAA